MNRFKVVVPCYNSMPWLKKTLASIEEQTYTYYDVCIIDDASDHPDQRRVIQEYADRNGWLTIFNETNRGAMANFVAGIKALDCVDDDIIILLDGDDWFFCPWVFECVNEVYSSKPVLMTYGKYVEWTTGRINPFAKADSWWTKKRRNYRKKAWGYDPVRTFKHVLWRNIRDEDFRDQNGEYFSVSSDVAYMFPMLEMAGDRIYFIPEVLYVYNQARPINDYKLRREEQLKCEAYLRNKPKYKKLVLEHAV